MDEKELISKAMAALGSRVTEAKREAARRNGASTRFAAKPLAELDCTCGALFDESHKATCPRGRAFRRRLKQQQAASPQNADSATV